MLQKVKGFYTSWYSCSDSWQISFSFFYGAPYFGLMHFEMVGNHSRRAQSMIHIKQFNYFCNVVTFLCFLRPLTASLVAPHLGPIMLFRVHNIAVNTKKYKRTTIGHFLLCYAIYWRDELTWTWWASQGILSVYSQYLSSAQ